MARRDRHPNKDIQRAIASALKLGWELERGKGHRWATLSCGHGCRLGIWSSPRQPGTMAKRIMEEVRKCPHDLDAR